MPMFAQWGDNYDPDIRNTFTLAVVTKWSLCLQATKIMAKSAGCGPMSPNRQVRGADYKIT